MRPLKEALLFSLAIAAIVFSYLLATGVFLFALTDTFRAAEARDNPPASFGRTASNFTDSKSNKGQT